MKQRPFTAMTTPRDPEIVRLAEKCCEHRDARIKAQMLEAEALKLLMRALKERRIDRYEDREEMLVVEVERTEKVRINELEEE